MLLNVYYLKNLCLKYKFTKGEFLLKKIKILIYGMQDIRGGIEMYLYNLAKYCDYTKFSLTFLDTQANGIIYEKVLA